MNPPTSRAPRSWSTAAGPPSDVGHLMAAPKKPAAAVAPWQVLDSKYSYRDRWLAVRSDTVRVPNGTILSPYHTIEFPEWICAVALTPDKEIVLVEEYRHGVGRASFE